MFAANRSLSDDSTLPLQGLKRTGISLKDCGVDVLHEAAEMGLLGLINYALDTREIGIDSLGYQEEDGYERQGATPLYLAILQDHDEAARLLLDRGANPSARSGLRQTWYPLTSAVWGLHHGMAKMLIDAGADVACRDTLNHTPILCATMTRDIEMSTLLLYAGADIFTTDVDDQSLFSIAFRISDDPSLVEMLLLRSGLAPEYEKKNYLTAAVERGWCNVAKLLIEKGADVEYNAFRQRPVPLLRAAIMMEHLDIAELLIQQGADVNARGFDQSCALHYTGEAKHLSLVKSLVAAGADVSATNAQGCQPLMLAKSAAIVEILLANGANYEHSSERCEKALVTAVVQGRFDVAKLLLQAGASTRGSDDFSIVHYACQIGNLHIVELLLDYGADISSNNPLGNSTLIIAAKSGRLSIVRLLLERGADVEEAAENGDTPLMMAARNGHCGIVDILIRHFGEHRRIFLYSAPRCG
ncbi:hypothetical protein LLEC1_07072 [Akanthomyces lecanii]|uniref:Uncharacterized protein n=1 Tax=Cordyceps confragosa TaxID=2714763 RepID=A0A179I5C6_CORDF|nr:hypothetical protein LLEC1_07072 [Akanthomyces lecanii]